MFQVAKLNVMAGQRAIYRVMRETNWFRGREEITTEMNVYLYGQTSIVQVQSLYDLYLQVWTNTNCRTCFDNMESAFRFLIKSLGISNEEEYTHMIQRFQVLFSNYRTWYTYCSVEMS